MDEQKIPEPLRRTIHQLVSEAVLNCREVLRYANPDMPGQWWKMTLYRASDAADTMDKLAMLTAAYCEQAGTPQGTLDRYLQTGQQRLRADGPQDGEREHLAGMLGEPCPTSPPTLRYRWGQQCSDEDLEAEIDAQWLLTEACLHGLSARLSDDVDALDSYLPPRVAELARKVAGVLEVPESASVT